MDYKKLKFCRVCGSSSLKKYLDLGQQPLANSLLKSKSQKFPKFPLQVLFCDNCAMSQLSVVVEPSVMYKDYPYHSSVSGTFRKHCIEMAGHLQQLFKFNYLPKLIDIASNDGCLLSAFRRSGYGLMWGVEPSKNLAKIAEGQGHAIVNDFWCERSVKELPQVDFITALNVVAHVDDIEVFFNTVYKKLLPNGIFIIEVPYLKNLIEKNQFDTVYHEHLSYFLLKPLRKCLKFCGLNVFRVEEIDMHGGSLRIFASKDNREVESSVWRIQSLENRAGLHSFDAYRNYAKKVKSIKDHMRSLFKELKFKKKKVIGYGASAKGITLLNYCGMDSTDISAIVDETKDKQGKFTPGSKIPIVNEDHFDTTHPDYIALMSWNFTAELKEKTKHVGAKYIIPIPRVRIE